MNTDPTLVKLLEGWLDGGLSEQEQSVLLCQLGQDPQLRRCFAQQVAVLGATRAAADANPRWLALFDLLEREDGPEGELSSFEALTMNRIESTSLRTRRAQPGLWALAAAVTLLLTWVFLFKPRESNPDGGMAASLPTGPAGVSSAVAIVTGGSPEAGFEIGTYLKPGVISQNEGWISLQTLKGVSVTLDAPFEATLSNHDRVHLNKGSARIRVPDGAEGFRLESRAFEVVDLGTEFAAKVNADGTGTCRVFEGMADVMLLDSMGEAKETRRLTASKSVRINPSSQAMQVIEEKDEDYPELKQSPRPALRLAPSYASRVMAMGPAGYWRFETLADGKIPNEVPGLASMHAAGGAAVSVEESGNHSGDLTGRGKLKFFKVQGGTQAMLEQDFTISFFAQFSWLQNFAMISAMRYDDTVKGHSLILQCYASLYRIGIDGSALHALFRDPPAWDGGAEIVGAARLRPLYWHHITFTRRDGIATIYLDGMAITRDPVGTSPLDCREIFIGRLNGNARQPRTEAREMVGHIDELAIFQRALSEEEIAELGMKEDNPK